MASKLFSEEPTQAITKVTMAARDQGDAVFRIQMGPDYELMVSLDMGTYCCESATLTVKYGDMGVEADNDTEELKGSVEETFRELVGRRVTGVRYLPGDTITAVVGICLDGEDIPSLVVTAENDHNGYYPHTFSYEFRGPWGVLEDSADL